MNTRPLKWAVEFFRDLADELTPEGSGRMAYDAETLVDMYDNWRLEDPKAFDAHMACLFRVSLTNEGDAAIFELCALAAELIERGEPLPKHLKVFIVKFLRRDPIFDIARKRGPRYGDLAHRDVCIIEAMQYIVKTWGFSATRNSASRDGAKHPSAASITREALEKGAKLHLTEAAVNKIWQAFGRM